MNTFDIFQNHFKAIFPELFFIIAIFIILIYGTVYNSSAYYKFPILMRATAWLSIQTLLITLFLIVCGPWAAPAKRAVIFNGALTIDAFGSLTQAIVLISSIATILISFNYIKNQKMYARAHEYMVLILFSTLSMLFIISSFDLISMYLAIELQSLSFYVLAAFQRNNEFSTEAGLKYFVLGALSSGLLLFGESLLYGFTGLSNFEELARLFTLAPELASLSSTPFQTASFFTFGDIIGISLLFILVAFLFKISAVPFHMWTPDVYEGAPTSVTTFFATAPKVATFALLLRLCIYTFYDVMHIWVGIIVICSFLSMFIGTFGALHQNKIKRLFAYSSIAHVGYLLISLATGTVASVEALLVYLITYIVTVLSAFNILLVLARENFSPNLAWSKENVMHVFSPAASVAVVAEESQKENNSIDNRTFIPRPQQLNYLKASYPIWDPYQSLNNLGFGQFHQKGGQQKKNLNYLNFSGGQNPNEKKTEYAKHITDFASLSRSNPLLAATAALIFFSNAGIPPLAGFYGKLNVFLAAVEGSMYFLALSGILCSVIGAFYSIRLVKIIYFHSMSDRNRHQWQPISKEAAIIMALTFFFTLFFFVMFAPSFLFVVAHLWATSLCI
jgi:proton-translocating NADH-quinone oxidoreductase chain N